MQTPFLLLQVSYLPCATCFRTSDRFLLAVSCPKDAIVFCHRLLCIASSFCLHAHFASLLLILSGDIELNPGPTENNAPPTLESISQAILRIESSQNTILSELALIRSTQTTIEDSARRLSSRVEVLEKIVENNPENDAASKATPDMTKHSSDVKLLTTKYDDAENRLRRSNLLFFGITDDLGETWAQSEERVVSFCSDKLDISIENHQIERAHRLGRFEVGKNRPIIVELTHFKDKSGILLAGPKLKDTSFSIREDYSAKVRVARKKLFTYGQQNNASFKIRFDKLLIGKKVFTYNADTDSVVELKP
ncbi:uncharacterized protein LOC144133474 [Amblyomma americanum]